jgi:hypothetical protein
MRFSLATLIPNEHELIEDEIARARRNLTPSAINSNV